MDQDAAARVVQELFTEWYGCLLRFVERRCGQTAIAEEVVQDTFLALYEALIHGANVRHPKAWTMTVARRKLFERSREPLDDLSGHEPLPEGDLMQALPESVDYLHDLSRVKGMFAVLSAREEEVLMLRLQSMKYRQIADALGISANSVNTLLARACAKLHRALEGQNRLTAQSGGPRRVRTS